MSRGVNRVIIVGNCGQDPEVRYMPNGGAVCNVSIATSEEWMDKQSGQKQTRTEWHRVVLMDRGNFKLGEIAGQYLKKGGQVYIEGKLQTREWEKDGVKRYITEIIANEMQLLGSRPEQSNQSQSGYKQQQQQQQQTPQQNQPKQQQSHAGFSKQPEHGDFNGFNQSQNNPPISDFNDDIPF